MSSEPISGMAVMHTIPPTPPIQAPAVSPFADPSKELHDTPQSASISEPATLAPDVVPSTRPPQDRTVSELSHVTEPASTPKTELTESTPTQTPPEAVVEHDPNVDPKVASLQGMFPDFDAFVLQSVLEVHGGDQDRAIDALLGMSDPEYHSAAPPTEQHGDTNLDELIARRLFLEDQQAQQEYEQRTIRETPYQARQNPPQGQQNAGTGIGAGSGFESTAAEITNQFKSFVSTAQAKLATSGFGRGGAGNNAVAGPPGSTRTQGELTQQLGQYAEAGRKQFSSIVTKVKAKIQEYDNPVPNPQGPGGFPAGAGNPGAAGYSSYGPSTSYGQPNSNTQQQPYYAPAPNAPLPQPAIGGYHISSLVLTTPSDRPSANAASRPGVGLNAPAPNMPQRSSFDQTETPRANFDTSRLGLKPKRPVSLIGGGQPAASPPNTKGKGRASEEEIEYVSSPFEER